MLQLEGQRFGKLLMRSLFSFLFVAGLMLIGAAMIGYDQWQAVIQEMLINSTCVVYLQEIFGESKDI